jgi:hypothetical protein
VRDELVVVEAVAAVVVVAVVVVVLLLLLVVVVVVVARRRRQERVAMPATCRLATCPTRTQGPCLPRAALQADSETKGAWRGVALLPWKRTTPNTTARHRAIHSRARPRARARPPRTPKARGRTPHAYVLRRGWRR